jgi:DNA-binding MarR family transcriptional regulator
MSEREQDFLTLLPLFQKTLLRIGAHRTRSRTDRDLTYLQLGVLGSVANRGTPAMSQIAADSFVTPPAATRVVGELVDKGLLERVTDPEDRRVVRISIQEAGRRVLHQAHAEGAHMLAQIVAEMGEADRLALAAGLGGFLKAAAALEAGDQ